MEQQPFDPIEDFDAMAEWIKQRVTDIALAAHDHPVYKAMPATKQIDCMMAGILTGLVGVCFASIRPEGRGEMMKIIEAYLPQARQNAEDILSN